MSTSTHIRCCVILIVGVCLTTLIRAGLPQPAFILYGQALDEYGWPYLADAEVILRVNGRECARHAVDRSIRPGVNFVLRVPLDHGAGEAYAPSAARTGDIATIAVVAGGVEQAVMNPFPLPQVGDVGEIVALNVTAGQDLDGDGLPDAWEQALVDYDPSDDVNGVEDVDGADDFDGDGMSNLEEYRAGTFGELVYDYFFVEAFSASGSERVGLGCLSIPGKVYSVSVTSNLVSGTWSPCAASTSAASPLADGPTEGTGDFLTLFVESQGPNARYRLEVR